MVEKPDNRDEIITKGSDITAKQAIAEISMKKSTIYAINKKFT